MSVDFMARLHDPSYRCGLAARITFVAVAALGVIALLNQLGCLPAG